MWQGAIRGDGGWRVGAEDVQGARRGRRAGGAHRLIGRQEQTGGLVERGRCADAIGVAGSAGASDGSHDGLERQAYLWPSVAISGHRRSSVAISGHQWQSDGPCAPCSPSGGPHRPSLRDGRLPTAFRAAPRAAALFFGAALRAAADALLLRSCRLRCLRTCEPGGWCEREGKGMAWTRAWTLCECGRGMVCTRARTSSSRSRSCSRRCSSPRSRSAGSGAHPCPPHRATCGHRCDECTCVNESALNPIGTIASSKMHKGRSTYEWRAAAKEQRSQRAFGIGSSKGAEEAE